MNNNNHIDQLFNRLLNNSITEEELQELLKHIRNSESENEIKTLMDSHWQDIREELVVNEPGLRTDSRFSEILKMVKPAQVQTEKQKKSTSVAKKIPFQWMGIAASVLFLVSIGIYWFANRDIPADLSQTEQVASVNYNGKQVVHLPDGSSVILNEGSQLTYSEDFGQGSREVTFSGEGYFDIAHDPERPFVVHTDQVKTTVLGTAFNLIAFKDQSEVVVTVARGKVAVGDDIRTYDNILPKQQLVVDKQTRKFEKAEVNLQEVLAWKENFLILDGLTVASAAELIGSRHHVKITIVNDEVKNCRINAAFMKGETLEQILRVVCGVLQAEFSMDGNRVEITGGRECK